MIRFALVSGPYPADGDDVDGAWLVNERGRGLRAIGWRELVEGRDLALLLAARDLKVRYRQTVLGVLWAVLEPLAGALALVFVFGRLAGAGPEATPHLPFAIVGFAAWSYFSGAASGAGNSLVQHADLVSKVYFPRLLLPIGALLPGIVDLGIALALGAGVAAAAGVRPGPAVVLLPFWVLLLVVASCGPGLTFGALNVRFRDVRYVFAMSLQLLFFLTPVAYAAELVDRRWLPLYALNPLAGVIGGLRWSLLGVGSPAGWWLVSGAVAVAWLVLGLVVFQQGERRFADVI